jgi:hypothetical protein
VSGIVLIWLWLRKVISGAFLEQPSRLKALVAVVVVATAGGWHRARI